VLLATLLMYITLAVCAAAVGAVVIRYDLYVQEPLRWMLFAGALGVGAMWIATGVQIDVIHVMADRMVFLDNVSLAVLAGTTEEVGKFAVVAVIAAVFKRRFRGPLDGLVYGSFAGLGVALLESVWTLGGAHHAALLPPEEPVRLAGHVVMGGIGAFGLGVTTVRGKSAAMWVAFSLLLAVMLHTVWDVTAFDAADHFERAGKLRVWHVATPIVLMLGGMLVYRTFAEIGARMTRSKLQVCDLATKRCPPF